MTSIAFASHTGCQRSHNEDSLLIGTLYSGGATIDPTQIEVVPPPLLLGVFDGMGGHSSGDRASLIASRTVALRDDVADPARLLELANDALYDEVERYPDLRGMGATAVAARPGDSVWTIANVGDARAYSYAAGVAVMATVDDRDRRRQGVITQSLGGLSHRTPVQPHLVELAIGEFDRLLLCTDGLTDELDLTTLQAMLGAASPLTAVRDLLEAALEAGGRDNITLIVVEPNRPDPTAERST
jgi:protein phosphatase